MLYFNTHKNINRIFFLIFINKYETKIKKKILSTKNSLLM